jgi:hypothetical protein
LGTAYDPVRSRAGSAQSRITKKLHFAFLLLALAMSTETARIGGVTETSTAEQAARFFSMSDRSVRYALLGSVLLGINCGLLGSFLVVQKWLWWATRSHMPCWRELRSAFSGIRRKTRWRSSSAPRSLAC